MTSSSSITSICCRRPWAASTIPSPDRTSSGVPCRIVSFCALWAADLGARRSQRQRRVVGIHPRAGSAAEELLGPLVVQLGLRLHRLLHLQSRLCLRQLGPACGREGPAGHLLQYALRLFELPLGDEALCRKVPLLQRHERLSGHDLVSFANMNLEHSAADT